MTRIAEPGSVISATLRLEDLLPAFCDALMALEPDANEQKFVAGVREYMHDPLYFTTEEAIEDGICLTDMLQGHAPEGHYFGAHEGDGSDFGYWTIPQWVWDDEPQEEGMYALVVHAVTHLARIVLTSCTDRLSWLDGKTFATIQEAKDYAASKGIELAA